MKKEEFFKKIEVTVARDTGFEGGATVTGTLHVHSRSEIDGATFFLRGEEEIRKASLGIKQKIFESFYSDKRKEFGEKMAEFLRCDPILEVAKIQSLKSELMEMASGL